MFSKKNLTVTVKTIAIVTDSYQEQLSVVKTSERISYKVDINWFVSTLNQILISIMETKKKTVLININLNETNVEIDEKLSIGQIKI